jgi:NADPH:quinone reductase
MAGVADALPRVVPHSDGAGIIDAVGPGVPEDRLDTPAWCYGAQSYRAFGTAAEYVVVRDALAVPLPRPGLEDQAACLGIAGITGYRAVFADGSVNGLDVLVHGAAGGVGAVGGVISFYFTSDARPVIPYWELGFADITLRLLGSDDFPAQVKAEAANKLTDVLVEGTLTSRIAAVLPLGRIAEAHELVEAGAGGRVLVELGNDG